MWHIVKVRSGTEERVKELLSKHFEVEWPSVKKLEVRTPEGRRYRISLSKDKQLSIGGAKITVKDGKFQVEGSKVKVKVVSTDAPLRGYLFVKGDPSEITKKTENLKDVVGLLVTAKGVASISDEELTKLKEKIQKGEKIKSLFPEKGMKVKIASGQWTGMQGIIEEVHEDLSLSVRILLYDHPITIHVPLHSVILI